MKKGQSQSYSNNFLKLSSKNKKMRKNYQNLQNFEEFLYRIVSNTHVPHITLFSLSITTEPVLIQRKLIECRATLKIFYLINVEPYVFRPAILYQILKQIILFHGIFLTAGFVVVVTQQIPNNKDDNIHKSEAFFSNIKKCKQIFRVNL